MALNKIAVAEIEKNLMYRQKYYDNSAKSLRRLAFKVKKQKEKSAITSIRDEGSVERKGKLERLLPVSL